MPELNKRTRLLAISLPAMAFAISQPAFAQEGQALAQEEEDASVEYDGNVIIVTATQRASDVQDIPIAVTAVSPVQLERQGIVDIKTLSSVAAGLSISSSNTETQGTSIRIRGVGTAGNNIGLESAVGVFIDGVYQSRPGVALGELVDVEQVEVLRGPQGTLFGRNTTAGALVVRNKRPDLLEFGGNVSATYGNFNLVNLQGAFNAPLVEDQLGLRITGAYRNRDGFTTSTEDGSSSYSRDRFLIRGQLLWEPSADVSLRLIADYQETDENCCASVTLATSPNLPAALSDATFPSGVPTAGFPRAALGGVSSEFPFEPGLITNAQQSDSIIEQWGVSGELVWDFGAAELTVIGSYRDFFGISNQGDNVALSLFDIGANTPLRTDAPNFADDIITYSGEARLQGSAFNDALDWLVGVYYSNEEIEEVFSLTYGSDFGTLVGSGLGIPALFPTATSVGNLLAGDGTFTPIDTAGAFADNQFTQEGESFSVFTHNIFSVTDTISLTLGARYVDDTKDGRFSQIAQNNPACAALLGASGRLGGAGGAADQAAAIAAVDGILGPGGAASLTTPLGPGFPSLLGLGTALGCTAFTAPAVPPGTGGGLLPETFDQTFSDDEFIYTLQGSWKPHSDLLIYAGFTHGYKAGGFNLDSSAAIGGASPQFGSEEVDAYEIGVKSTLFDGGLKANVAFFYNDLTDFQVLEFTGVQFQTFNVADVSSKGVEVELFAQWSDYISTNLNVNYTDAQFGDDCAANATAATVAIVQQLCGFSLGNAPKWTGVFGTTYDGPLSGDVDLIANVNIRYESDRRTGVGTPVLLGTQDAHFKANARLGFTLDNGRYGIELWGNNLTNEITRSVTFNTGFVGLAAAGTQAVSAFIEEPRTYGATVRAKF